MAGQVQSAPDTLLVQVSTPVRNGFARKMGRDAVNLISTIALTYAQPLHWQKKDFMCLGGAVLLTGVALLADEPLYRLMQDNRNNTFDALEKAGDFSGKPQHNYHSFPSGHTMLAVATSWILARQTGFVPLKIVFYSLPVLTGLSRVYVGAHWFSDIVLGSA